ncbi:hypothetical protein HN873_005431 [Arachis hypogaea]
MKSPGGRIKKRVQKSKKPARILRPRKLTTTLGQKSSQSSLSSMKRTNPRERQQKTTQSEPAKQSHPQPKPKTIPPTTSEHGTQSQPNLQQDDVPTQESRAKQRNRKNSYKRPAHSGQTFVQGGIGEAPKIFVPRATSESSESDDDDSDPDYHQYESEELHSPYSSDCDSEYEAERNVWPQGNPNAAFGSVHLELGMEFKTME